MVRDFTDRAKKELLSLVSETENEKMCDFTDWIGDRWYDFEEWIGLLNIKEDLSNVNSYHKKIIDKNNATLSEIETIFNNVYDIEAQYNGTIKNIIETCRAFNQLLTQLNDIIIPKNGGFTVDNIRFILKSPFSEYLNLFQTYIEWETKLRILLEQYKQKDVITDEDKDIYIQLYETYNAELKKKLDNLLHTLSEEQIREIKFILYTAEEPYKSIYLNELESYTIGNTSGEDTGYFTTGNNTINVDMPAEESNPRGPYTTFFHESGHAIDYNYENDGSFYSMTYRNEEGLSLQDVIYEDVRNDISATIANYTTDKESQERLLAYIMGAGQVDINTLSKTEKKLLENIQNYYSNEMYGAMNEACSDVYGGVTNNIVHGSYGHWSDTYWYDSDGNATYKQSRELWAEYYSYCMTGNEEAMENLREHFPNASKFLDEMAASMVS